MCALKCLKQISCVRLVTLIAFCFTIIISFMSCEDEHPATSTFSNDKEETIIFYEKTLDSLQGVDLPGALSYIQKLLKNDTVIANPRLFNTIIERAGIIKAYSGDTDSSLYFWEKAKNYWMTDTTLIGREHYGAVLNNIGFTYFSKGDLTKALKTFEEAREFSSSSGSMPLRINSHLNLSDVYQALGDYGKALDHIEQCITLCAENKDSVKLTNAINAYAILYSNCQLFDEAQQLFDIELKYSRHFSPYMEFNYYNSKGRMFYLKEDFVRAKKEFLNGLAVVPRDDSYANMIILSNLAETYLLLNNPDSAKVYLDKVSEMGIGLSTMPIFNFNYHSLLGNFYWQKTEFEKAKKAFEKADMIATQIDVDKVLRKLHIQRKTKFYISTKNYQQASLLLQDFVKLNDLILQEDNLKLVAGLKYKFERDATIINQRSELALKEQELKSYRFQRTILVVGIFFLALVTVLIILFFRKARALNYEKNIRRISALKMENVRGHISPHFTFNILNNIWTIIDDRENARFQFDNLMNMIRHSLVNTEKIAIPLAEEIEFVTSYLNLQNFRMDGELDIVWNIDLGVDLTTLVPGMILQIPVENSIKHGLSPKQGTKKLSIGVAIDDGVLIVVITDNGVGYNAKAITSKGTGTGLKVLTNTINLLNQINARKMSYDIQSQNNDGESGTKVTVKIPLNYNFNLS